VEAATKAGPGQPLVYHGIEDEARAAEIRKGLYRCARHRGLSLTVTWPYGGEMTSKTIQWPPDKSKDGTYALTFTIFAKGHGRKHVVQTMGTDRSQWHYNPRQRKEAS